MAPPLSAAASASPSPLSPPPVSHPAFTPALSPPEGVTSNHDHPESLAHLSDITIAICLSLVTVFFLLRSYVRICIKRTWIFEDVLVTVAWVGTVAYCGVMRATMAHHGGQHSWDLTMDEFHDAAYWFNVAAIGYGVIIGVTKLAVLWLYRRIFSPIRWSTFDISIVVLEVLIFGFYSSTTMVKIFECSPREKIWDDEVPGKCLEMKWILMASGGFNTVTDFLIMLLPIQAIWKLQMDKLKQILVVLAFTFGLCAPVFATIGFVVRIQNSDNLDTSWKQPEILLWGAAELTSGTLVVCFPELAVLFRRRGRRGRGPRRADTSELNDWDARNRVVNPASHPYFTKSLMSTEFISRATGNGQYIELQEHGNNVRITAPMGTSTRGKTPENGVVVLRNEFRVERQPRPRW